MERLHGFVKTPIAEIATGDIVMFHPEDQFEYRAERTRTMVVLRPKMERCSEVSYEATSPRMLWVKN